MFGDDLKITTFEDRDVGYHLGADCFGEGDEEASGIGPAGQCRLKTITNLNVGTSLAFRPRGAAPPLS